MLGEMTPWQLHTMEETHWNYEGKKDGWVQKSGGYTITRCLC